MSPATPGRIEVAEKSLACETLNKPPIDGICRDEALAAHLREFKLRPREPRGVANLGSSCGGYLGETHDSFLAKPKGRLKNNFRNLLYSEEVFPCSFDMPGYAERVEVQMVNFYRSLSEKDRRRYAAVEAGKLDHGGVVYIAELFGCDPDTIRRGMTDVEHLPQDTAEGRVRKKGRSQES